MSGIRKHGIWHGESCHLSWTSSLHSATVAFKWPLVLIISSDDPNQTNVLNTYSDITHVECYVEKTKITY